MDTGLSVCNERRATWRQGFTVMGEFRVALVQDIREHPLAWSFVLAGAIGAAILWACIAGGPIVHESGFYIPMDAIGAPPA